MNYPNFVMDRKTGSKLQPNRMNGITDGNFNRTPKKGAYNFHRPWNNVQINQPNENFRNVENQRFQTIDDYVKDDVQAGGDSNETEKKCNTELGQERTVENAWNADNINKEDSNQIADDEKKTEKKQDRQEFKGHGKRDENQKPHLPNKKKAKAEASATKPIEVDEEGFTKVKYRHAAGAKKQKNTESHNENVNWIVPGRDNKEQM